METIFWIAVAMFCIAAIMVAVVVRKHNKMFKAKDPAPHDEVYCEDFERAFYNP